MAVLWFPFKPPKAKQGARRFLKTRQAHLVSLGVTKNPLPGAERVSPLHRFLPASYARHARTCGRRALWDLPSLSFQELRQAADVSGAAGRVAGGGEGKKWFGSRASAMKTKAYPATHTDTHAEGREVSPVEPWGIRV